jgi:protoporphyrinogen oxidase
VAELDALLAEQPIALAGNYLNGLSLGDCAQRAEAEAMRLLALG